MRLEIAVQNDRLESGPILSHAALGADDTVKRIQISGDTVLTEKRQVKLRLGDSAAPTKWWLSAELGQHKLLDRVIEKSPAGANAGLAGIARTPGHADAGSEGLVIGCSHARRNAGVARNDQPDRVLRRAIRVGTPAREDGRRLVGPESLDVLSLIR